MKRLVFTLATILIICLLTVSGFSAHAAEISLYSTGDESSFQPNNGESAQTSESNEEIEEDLPSYYSSVEMGYTTPVKYQIGEVCWAFSSIAMFESLLLKDSLLSGDLSTDKLNKWGTTDENGYGWQRGSGESGYTSIATGYFTSWSGPVYTDENAPNYGATALRFFSKGEKSAIKKAVMEHGAVAINLSINSNGRSLDRSSFYIGEEVNPLSGHSMAIVGWDDNYSKEKFTGSYKPENDGAWLCKNSWGEDDTPIGGYIWVSYEDYYINNNEFFDEGFVVESYQEIKETDHLYQNEIYGATYEFQYVPENTQTFFNVFDFSESGNVLDKVIFETQSAGAEYNVYYVPLDSQEKPVQNRHKWTKLHSGTADYRGYICCDFEDMTISKARAAIAVELTSSPDSDCGIGVSEWLRNKETQNMIFKYPCESGKSFIEFSEGLYDVKDYYLDNLNDEIGGTLVIKAVTNKTTITDIKGDVDLDETIHINDATLIQLYLLNLRQELYADQLINADFNNDNKININDVTAIQLHLAGEI